MVDEADDAIGTAAPRKRSGWSTLDVLTRRLVLGSAVLMLAVLAMTGAILYYASSGTTVPRTAVERDMMLARQKTKANPKDRDAWVALAQAATQGGKFEDAEASIKALESLTGQSIVELLRGDLAYAKGDVSGARGHYEKAITQAKKDRDAVVADLASKGMPASAAGESEQAMVAYLSLARLDTEAKDYKAAVKNLKAAVEIDPTAADAWTALGDAQRKVGSEKDAEASYRKALTFIPDFEPALAGLESLGGGR